MKADAVVTLRSKQNYFFHTPDFDLMFVPMGEYKGQSKNLEEGYFYSDVPVLVTYVDDFGKTKIRHENFAQHLINTKDVEVVEIKEKEIIDAPIVIPKKKGK